MLSKSDTMMQSGALVVRMEIRSFHQAELGYNGICQAYVHIHTYIHALHCIALHCIALHYITLHYITLHYITLHYIALHYITLIHTYIHTLHYITLHYITLHYITLHYITYIHTYMCIYIYMSSGQHYLLNLMPCTNLSRPLSVVRISVLPKVSQMGYRYRVVPYRLWMSWATSGRPGLNQYYNHVLVSCSYAYTCIVIIYIHIFFVCTHSYHISSI